MSALLMGRVFYVKLPINLKMCLLALADHANDDGSGIWAGQRLIAYKAGVTDRAIRNSLRALRDQGWIAREERPSHYGTDRYVINADRLPSSDDIMLIKRGLRRAPEESSAGHFPSTGSRAPDHRKSKPADLLQTSAKPSSSKPSGKLQYTADFLEIWNLYPPRNGRREKKAEAALEWAKLRPSEELRATIVRAIRALHGATDTPVDLCRYLKHRRWEDETVSGRAAAGPPPAPIAKPADGGVIARLQREGLLANGVDHAGSS